MQIDEYLVYHPQYGVLDPPPADGFRGLEKTEWVVGSTMREERYFWLYLHPTVHELLKKVFPLCENHFFFTGTSRSRRRIIHFQGEHIPWLEAQWATK